MSRAVGYRLPEDLVWAIKDAAAEAGVSATEYVRTAIVARLEAPTILDVPMPAVPRDTPEVEVCAHPFRDNTNTCRVCGQQR